MHFFKIGISAPGNYSFPHLYEVYLVYKNLHVINIYNLVIWEIIYTHVTITIIQVINLLIISEVSLHPFVVLSPFPIPRKDTVDITKSYGL